MRAARADALDEAKKRGTLVVGMEAAYVPYEFFKDGKIIGYDPDIIDMLRPQAGSEGRSFVDTAWSGIIPALYAEEVRRHRFRDDDHSERAREGIVLHALCRRQQRHPAARRTRTRIKTADDLSGKVVGVQIGSAAAGIIKTFEAKLKAAGKPGYAEREAVRALPGSISGPAQQARRCGGELEVNDAGGDEAMRRASSR